MAWEKNDIDYTAKETRCCHDVMINRVNQCMALNAFVFLLITQRAYLLILSHHNHFICLVVGLSSVADHIARVNVDKIQ